MSERTSSIAASRSFGGEWAVAALERGDKVAPTAHHTASLDHLVNQYGGALCRSN